MYVLFPKAATQELQPVDANPRASATKAFAVTMAFVWSVRKEPLGALAKKTRTLVTSVFRAKTVSVQDVLAKPTVPATATTAVIQVIVAQEPPIELEPANLARAQISSTATARKMRIVAHWLVSTNAAKTSAKPTKYPKIPNVILPAKVTSKIAMVLSESVTHVFG